MFLEHSNFSITSSVYVLFFNILHFYDIFHTSIIMLYNSLKESRNCNLQTSPKFTFSTL